MAVRVLKVANELQFHSDGQADDSAVADYLCGLVNAEKRKLSKSDAAKAYLGDLALKERQLKEEKVRVLKDLEAREDEKSRDFSLSLELRQLAEVRSLAAKEQARQLVAELDGRQAG